MELETLIRREEPVKNIASSEISPCKSTEKVHKAVHKTVLDRKRRLLVVHKDQFHGIVGRRDLLNYMGAGELKKHKSDGATVKRVMSRGFVTLKKSYPVGKVLDLLRTGKQDAYPIADKGKLSGMVEERDFVKLIKNEMGVKVKDIMSPVPFFAKPEWSIGDVSKMLCHGPFERLPVVENGIVVGVITPHDILSYAAQRKKKSIHKDKMEIKHIMSRDLATIEPQEDVAEAVKKMKARGIGFLPVVEDLELVGVVTEKDILNTFKN
jgi:predicted transcriptional regulator